MSDPDASLHRVSDSDALIASGIVNFFRVMIEGSRLPSGRNHHVMYTDLPAGPFLPMACSACCWCSAASRDEVMCPFVIPRGAGVPPPRVMDQMVAALTLQDALFGRVAAGPHLGLRRRCGGGDGAVIPSFEATPNLY